MAKRDPQPAHLGGAELVRQLPVLAVCTTTYVLLCTCSTCSACSSCAVGQQVDINESFKAKPGSQPTHLRVAELVRQLPVVPALRVGHVVVLRREERREVLQQSRQQPPESGGVGASGACRVGRAQQVQIHHVAVALHKVVPARWVWEVWAEV